jgi:hypothetical protein
MKHLAASKGHTMATRPNLTLYRYAVGLANKLFEEIEEGQMHVQQAPGINPPIWIIGHLTMVNDLILNILGEATHCPKLWHATFGPNSRIDNIPADIGTKDEMVAVYNKTAELIIAAIDAKEDAFFAAPQQAPFLRQDLPTVHDLLGHLMFTHHTLHLGQLSVNRRLLGLPGVVRI